MMLPMIKKGENMNKKLLTIVIASVILVMVVSPVTATLPSESPLPDGGIWRIVWELLQDLQGQITNIQLTPGPQGEPGSAGQDGADGVDGISCWDINGDGTCNVDYEDVNSDGLCTPVDCQGPQGEPGSVGQDGADGVNGISCWDINGDGACNVDNEDVNADGLCTVADCQGPKGDKGEQGPTGAVVVACSNENNQNWICQYGSCTCSLNCPSGMWVLIVNEGGRTEHFGYLTTNAVSYIWDDDGSYHHAWALCG
jgi:hypothetical protein